MDAINSFVNAANGILFSNYVVYVLLGTGVLFTIWSGFGQYRAMTHGVQVVRGKYDESNDPGAINHFQALSAALSATVGLGNIAGVSVAVALGGPGAIFWMWVIGIVGMALKMTEVTQSMLYRNTDDPENPHGGPMFVAREGFKRLGLGWLGSLVGGLFVVTLLISAITGGNMFQSWNVADVTFTYFKVPTVVTGVILAVLVGLVIIGGIKRIGSVAGRIVPAMCLLYLTAALIVLVMNIGDIPEMLGLIVRHGTGQDAPADRAFIGGAFGFAAMWGIKRALFSSEAGQGSAPIAHSAARTNEPVREGVVAGLEPLIDTLVVCTITALVILSTGAWNRGPETMLPAGGSIVATQAVAVTGLDPESPGTVTDLQGRLVDTGNPDELTFFVNDTNPLITFSRDRVDAARTLELAGDSGTVDPATGVARLAQSWVIEVEERSVAPRNERAREVSGTWEVGDSFFVIIDTGVIGDHGTALARLYGDVRLEDDGSEDGRRVFTWRPVTPPDGEEWALEDLALQVDTEQNGNVPVYGDYAGASLTAHAFDREIPGLGMWLVTIASWLFALSTMISWSYYGEQGIVYLGGRSGAVFGYKIIYCALIVISCLGFIKTDEQLDMWTTMGLGVMLVVNIPIMLIFGGQAMKAYHEYMGRLKSGAMDEHEARDLVDMVEEHDEK